MLFGVIFSFKCKLQVKFAQWGYTAMKENFAECRMILGIVIQRYGSNSSYDD